MAQEYLTLERLRSTIFHAMGSTTDSVPSTWDVDEIINDGGVLLYSAHDWAFRIRPPVGMSFTAGQDYIDLPTDYGSLVGFQMDNTLNFSLTGTTPQQILDLRSTTVTVSQQNFWYAIMQPAQRDRKLPPGPPRMELWPTPSSDQANIMTIIHRAKWQKLYDDKDVADVPDYCESLLIQCVRGFALGWMERLMEPQGGVEGILERIRKGLVWQTAVEEDGMRQSNFGQHIGGAIELTYPNWSWRSSTASPVADPG